MASIYMVEDDMDYANAVVKVMKSMGHTVEIESDTVRALARLQPVLDTMKAIKQRNIWLELVNLIVPTLNDKRDDIARLIDWVLENLGADVPLHFSKFWPQYQLRNLPPTPEETLDAAWNMAKKKGVHYAYIGNIPAHEGNNTGCPKCHKLLVRRVGYDVMENDIVSGKCKFCGQAIPGIWE